MSDIVFAACGVFNKCESAFIVGVFGRCACATVLNQAESLCTSTVILYSFTFLKGTALQYYCSSPIDFKPKKIFNTFGTCSPQIKLLHYLIEKWLVHSN